MNDKKKIGMMGGVAGALLFVALFTGCSKAAPKPNATAFDSASAEVKGLWTEIQAAGATNGYILAITDCRKLNKDQSLTPEQRATLTDTSAQLQQKLFDAARNGDAAAAAAMEELRNVPR